MDKKQVNFLVTIDTEEEGNWGDNFFRADDCSTENIKHLPPFQALCDQYGVKPTYLIDYPVATQRHSVEILKGFLKAGKCEIATHLHPWCNPPYDEEISPRNSFTHNLPQELQYEKMKCLTETIENNFGSRPVCYRAGRYGFDKHFIAILEELNYTVDSSVVPYRKAKNEDEAEFGPVWVNPYSLDYDEILKAGKSKITELPITVEFTKRIPDVLKKNYQDLPNIGIRKILRSFFGIDLVWLRPSYSNLADMIRLSDAVIASGGKYLNMMFHSNELMPGGSPYNKTEQDVQNFLGKFSNLIKYLTQKYSVNFITLSETHI